LDILGPSILAVPQTSFAFGLKSARHAAELSVLRTRGHAHPFWNNQKRREEMSRGAVRTLLSAAGIAAATGIISTAQAQAPASAQRWQFAFVVDSSGPFAASETATAVGITIIARVGIMPNSSPFGTNNLGVARVGGGEGTFFMDFADPAGGPFQSSATHGPTGEGVDTDGNPLAGHFRAFRGSFAPQQGPDFVGDNNDPANGIFSNVGNNARVTSVVGSRSLNYNGTPLGVATLDAGGNIIGGDFANVYRVLFVPKPAAARTISLSWQGLSSRYVFLDVGGGQTLSTAGPNLANGNVTFRVPTPGAAALLGLGALVGLRRRRA
jgi:hypothetical protein